MNKNTLLYVFLCAITFFGLNLFFSSQRDKKNREILVQEEALKQHKQSENRADIEKRTVPLSSLPVVELFETSESPKVEAYGLDVEGAVVTLAWKTHLPERIFVKGQELKLVTKESVIHGPVVYVPSSFQNLNIAHLPDIGQYDLQLITFPHGEKPVVHLAEYEKENIQIPLSPLTENAIAVYKVGASYLPLGFYDAQGHIFVELQELPILSELALTKPVAPLAPTSKEQKYYVLENKTLQLVFTNVGGALAEINLPLEKGSQSQSVVKEIDFDRRILDENPSNARFPLHPYYTSDSKDIHPEGNLGGYYPLLRRGVADKENLKVPPEYYAVNIVSDYPEMAQLVYEVKEFSNDKIVFVALQPHRKITKTYRLSEQSAPYVFDLDVKIEGVSQGLWLTSGVPEVEIMSNNSSPQIQYRLTRKGTPDVEKLDLPSPKEVITVSSVTPDWVVNSNGYLGIIVDPLDEIGSGYRATAIPGTTLPTRLSLIDPKYQPYKASKYTAYEVLLPLPSQSGTTHFRIYAGPFEEKTLKAVDKIYSDPSSGYNPDYIAAKTFYGWFSFISEPFAKMLFVVMQFFYTITNSWAASIILLTLFLRVILYPLNSWSLKSMYRMKQISPEVQAIQKKYKKDPKKAQMEIMALYREKKVNPFTGCLPILIQIPFLIGMFDLLKSSFQLRGASFIPGWIDDLTAPDVLFSWNQPIFFIGTQFHLLPIILGVVMFLQQRFSNPALYQKNRTLTDQERQQKAMGTFMALLFTIMFYNFPSGLNIYWLSSMLLGILQQWITNKMMANKPIVLPKEGAKK